MGELAWGRLVSAVTSLRTWSAVATSVFAMLTLGTALLSHQGHRVVLASLFALSAAACAWVTRVARTSDEQRAERLLLVLCIVPTVDVLLALAITRNPDVIDFFYLLVFVYGFLAMRWWTLTALLVGAIGAWLVEVLWLGLVRGGIDHSLLQLALRSAVAMTVFRVRNRVDDHLRRTGRELDEQVTALRRTEELHGRELSRFRTMFEYAPLGMMVIDIDGVVVDANEAMLKIFGTARAELVGFPSEEFVHPDERQSPEQMRGLHDRMGGVGIGHMERRLLRAGGDVVDAACSARQIAGPEGERWVLLLIEDVTLRKSMERDLIRSRDGMRAVADISSASQRGMDPRPVAVSHLQRLTGAVGAAIIEPSDDRTLAICEGAQEHLQGTEFEMDGPSATAHVWRTGEPLFLAEAAASPMVRAGLLASAGMTSMMWQPVGAPGDLKAIIVMGWPETVEGVSELDRDAVRSIAAELASALTAERLREQLEERSRLDPLTGLINRRGWDHGVADMLRRSRQTGRPFVLAVADLDHFKQFNDEFGHLEGDILLSGFAATAQTMMRDDDLLARWGGEEFAVALSDCDLSDAQLVLERIRSAVPAGRTCSIGFATFHPDESVQDCMRRADAALYEAKARGRDRIEYGHYDAASSATGRIERRSAS